MLLTVLIDTMSFGIVMPVLPDLVRELGHVGLPEAIRIGGWLGVVFAGVQFLTGPLVGNLGDRFGRRPVLLCALAGFVLDYLLLSFAPSLGWLFLGRALAGLFGASFGPAGAALADLSTPEERARYYGMMGAAFGTGFVFGPALGGLLGEFGARAPFYLAAVLAALNFLLGLVAFPETLARENRRPFSLRRANPFGALKALGKLHGVIRLMCAFFFWQLAGMIYPATWAFFATAAYGWSPGMIGASLAYVGIMMAFSQAVIVGRVVKAVGERRATAIGIVGGTIQFLLYTIATASWAPFAIMLLMPAQSLVMPALSAMMSRRVEANAQGEVQGLAGSAGALAAIIAPAVYNPTMAYFTSARAPFHFPAIAFVMAAAMGLVALAILMVTPRRDQMPSATPA